jgi:hypothetical protein
VQDGVYVTFAAAEVAEEEEAVPSHTSASPTERDVWGEPFLRDIVG